MSPKEPDWVVSMIPDLPRPKSWNENVDAQCLVSMASTETGFIGPSATSGRKHIHAMDTKIYLHQKWLNDSSISSLGNIKATTKKLSFLSQQNWRERQTGIALSGKRFCWNTAHRLRSELPVPSWLLMVPLASHQVVTHDLEKPHQK